MHSGIASLIIVVLAGIGVVLWYSPLRLLSLFWVWLLIGVPRQLAASRVSCVEK